MFIEPIYADAMSAGWAFLFTSFEEDDGVFRGIQIPTDFFKIILWINDKGDLKATGFRLSQVDLVGDVDFEAIDIDQNPEFKEYQLSIADLEKETNMISVE